MADKIYPLNKNKLIFYTFLHDDYREVVCKNSICIERPSRDYTGRVFIEGKTYKFRKAKHEETDIDVWVVWSEIHKEPHFFMTSIFKSYFYVEQLLREEKLNGLGIV